MNASLNKKLNEVEWGEYRIIDIFDVKNTQSILSRDLTFSSGKTPYLCASSENNAVSSYVSYDERYIDRGDCVFIGGKTFVVSYQKADFFSNDSHNLALYLKDRKRKSKSIQLFLAACITMSLKHKYSWGNSISNQKIQNDVVLLPVKNGEIDFDFMESFIAELEAERVAELSAYLTVSGYDNYELSAEELDALQKYPNIKFDEFDILDVFTVRNTSNILSSDIVENSGKFPYLCASSENNAVSSYIEYDTAYLERGNCIFIGGKTFAVSYQEKDFYSNDSHNLALYLNNDLMRTKSNQLFIATCVCKSLSHKYSWGNSVSKAKIKGEKILLPTKNGQPDFDKMDVLISAIQKLVIRDVVRYSDQKIAATKEVVAHKSGE